MKIKPTDIKSSTYNDFDTANNGKGPRKLKVGDHVRTASYKNIFAKGYTPNQSEEVFVIEKVKSIALWTCLTEEPKGEEILGTFYRR